MASDGQGLYPAVQIERGCGVHLPLAGLPDGATRLALSQVLLVGDKPC